MSAGPAFAAAAALLAHAAPVEPQGPALQGPAVIVLWASWCASCRAEVERLPRIAPAAAPLLIATLAIDPPALARATLIARHQPTTAAYADAREPATVLAEWGGAGAALPLAVALNAKGQVCGQRRGLLGTDQLRQWARACSK